MNGVIIMKEGYLIDYISGLEVVDGPEEREATQVFSRDLVENYKYPKSYIITRPQYRVKVRPSDTKKEYPVDMNRIYATGGSMGCSGTFLLCNDYPELVACGVPITWPSIVDVKNFYNYTSVPIWYIIEDENNIIDGVNKIVRIINENGAPAWVTVDTGSNHSTASGLGNGVDKFGIFNWMFTQKKN